MHIRLLGDFRVAIGDEPVAVLNTPRLQTLLAYLLLHLGAPQSRQHLAFLLWPDSSEEQALANLRNLLFKLRSVLPITGRYLAAGRNTLLWQGDAALDIDVLRFEQALDEAERAARRRDTDAQAANLQEAVNLYTGDLLPSSYDDWVLGERERLQQRFASALESLITIFEQQGNVQGAIEASQRLLRHNPLHEAVYLRLMELYAANNMVPEALRVYHTCATTLERELGVEPGLNTSQAYERLLSSRRTMPMRNEGADQRRQTKDDRRLAGDERRSTKENPQPATRNPQLTTPFHIRLSPPLVGRASEWVLLQEAWQELSQGDDGIGDEGSAVSRAVLVRGEAGIGKSRLVEELFNQVTRQGVVAASARCYHIERRLAFGPVAGWLRALPIPQLSPVWLSEAARLRPDILDEFPGTSTPGPLTEAWQRIRFMEAISRVLLANQPLLLALDDLQWCDPDTLEYLHFLLRTSYDQGARLLLVMSARVEELDALAGVEQAQALTHFLDGLRDSDRLMEIDLAPLGLEESATLAAALSGGEELEPARASRLYRETEGNPLFIVEMLRTSTMRNSEFGMRNKESRDGIPNSASPAMADTRIPHSEGLPPRIARVLKERLAQLSPTARRLVDVAAVIGRDFTLPLLQIAAHESESVVVQAVDELWRRRIVREQGQDGYDFSHDKLRQAAYSALTSAKRRMLHGNVARALEEVYAGRLDPVSAQLGMHYEVAGDLPRAARYYRRAAEAAQQLFANTEASSLYERAFALAQQLAGSPSGDAESEGQDGPGRQELMVEIGESMADLLETVGDHARARGIYEQALQGCPQTRPLWRDRLLLKIGDTWRAQRNFDRAVEFYDSFEGLLGEEPTAGEDEWWALRIEGTVARLMTHYWQSEPAEMLELDEKMRPAVERHGSRTQKMKYYRCLATMHLRLDRYATSDECMYHIKAALAETIPLKNLTELTDTTFLMGFCLLWRGLNRPRDSDLPPAIDYLQQALSLAERTGQADYKLLSLAYLTIAYRMQGDVQKTRETIDRHVDYMYQVQSPSYRETAEANLAWVAWKDGDLEAAERHALTARPMFGSGESFTWLVTWPLVAVSLARGDVAAAVRYAAAQLAPNAQRAPDELIASVKAATHAWDSRQSDQTAHHLTQALAAAQECGYI